LVWRADGKPREAGEQLAALAAGFPRDRELLRQWGQTLYALGELTGARRALESILAIDPTDAAAYQMLSPIYQSSEMNAKADDAHARYLLWRDDPRAGGIAARFFAAHPQWADERIPAHTHGRAAQS
jgi:predicted Zn-dependent protease